MHHRSIPSHASQHGRSDSKRRLALALGITGSWFVIELIGGILTNSLALIADSGHMLSDVGALSLSLFALQIASRPATHQKTYGYRRAEILAALANGLLLVLVAGGIFWEAYQRFMDPPVVDSGAMLIVAGLGLVANLISARLLYPAQRESLNIRGAFMHVLGDTLGSIGAILAGLIMWIWQWYLADPIFSVLVAGLVLYASWHLVRESVDVLLEGTPRDLDIASILRDLGEIDGVVSVHDLHVWSITSGLPALSCHVVVHQDGDPTNILESCSKMMRQKHHIEHTTIQVEVETWVIPRDGAKLLF